jgi:hypothetical protein
MKKKMKYPGGKNGKNEKKATVTKGKLKMNKTIEPIKRMNKTIEPLYGDSTSQEAFFPMYGGPVSNEEITRKRLYDTIQQDDSLEEASFGVTGGPKNLDKKVSEEERKKKLKTLEDMRKKKLMNTMLYPGGMKGGMMVAKPKTYKKGKKGS